MPIQDCPFTLCNNGIYRPILPVKIINPHTNQHFRTLGIIDTGADECAVPAVYAPLLGHNLQAGQVKQVSTGNGLATAYAHTTKFEIYHPVTNTLAHTVNNTPIDFMPNLNVLLLGVRSFLSDFVLTVNYPQQIFSIRIPPS
jgi:hypothetical protein